MVKTGSLEEREKKKRKKIEENRRNTKGGNSLGLIPKYKVSQVCLDITLNKQEYVEIKEEEYRSNRSRKLKNERKEDRENKVEEKESLYNKI